VVEEMVATLTRPLPERAESFHASSLEPFDKLRGRMASGEKGTVSRADSVVSSPLDRDLA
jgi:hypothetical protein